MEGSVLLLSQPPSARGTAAPACLCFASHGRGDDANARNNHPAHANASHDGLRVPGRKDGPQGKDAAPHHGGHDSHGRDGHHGDAKKLVAVDLGDQHEGRGHDENARKNVERHQHRGHAPQDHKDERDFRTETVGHREPGFKRVKVVGAAKARAVVGAGGDEGVPGQQRTDAQEKENVVRQIVLVARRCRLVLAPKEGGAFVHVFGIGIRILVVVLLIRSSSRAPL